MSRTSFRVNPHSTVCLNVKELLARSRRHIQSLSDSNEIRIHNHLVRKPTLNHLAKLVKWVSCVVSTYLYGALGIQFNFKGALSGLRQFLAIEGPLKNDEKPFLFHLKSFLRSQDI